jgi:enamine deaminase RidA (YjgF/YER057c/UK114 family)
MSSFLPRRAIDGLHRAAKLLKNGPDDDMIDAAFEVHEGKPRAPLTGANATVSLSGQIAIVAECGTVILFDKERAAQLLAFFAGRAI